jgi:peptidoglycan/xylan/chitin deacetylase (PgdA/CDA1 family)
MTMMETAYLNILGFFPYYMRPPFLSTNALSLSVLSTLKYVVIEVDIDTQDWQNTDVSLEPYSFANYTTGFAAGGRLSLSHDPYTTTVNGYIPELLSWLAGQGLKCMSFLLAFLISH